MSKNLIEFNNISKFFGSVIALKDVTMHIKKGQIRLCTCGRRYGIQRQSYDIN